MKKLTIELDGGWVLTHRDDVALPVEVLKNEIDKIYGVVIGERTLNSITLTFDEQKFSDDKIVESIRNLYKFCYPDGGDDVLTFQIEESIKPDAEKPSAPESTEPSADTDDTDDTDAVETAAAAVETDDDDDETLREFERRRSEMMSRLLRAQAEACGRSERADGGKSAIEKIDELIGAAEFKALAKELVGVADGIKRTDTYEVFTNRCYLFSIGDGCGLTTYLKLLARLIEETGLNNAVARVVCEERLGEYREGPEPFQDAMNVLNGRRDKSLRVLSVDISEWMDRTDNKYFRQFLRAVEKHADEFIVVFRVPFVDKDILAGINRSLSDLLTVKTVSFPPLGGDELKACAEAEFNRLGFTVTKAVWKCFYERISEEKSDGKFYGINTVKKVVREFVYRKHIVNAQKKSESKQITFNDVRALCDNVDDINLSGAELLEKLVGIESVKKRVEEIVAQIELAAKNGDAERPCVHMRFVGNPGTGKTTVARILGKILKEKGVLRVGAFFEHSGRDFCGRYIGETAPKTTSICRDAYGSVLFIDEAYSLYRGDDDTRDFGREAIDTLIAEMENHRNDFVVIMAGYTNDIEKLMSGNQGLSSRMPYTIEFPNFTREQLYDIFVSMAKDKYRCDKGLFDAARSFFDGLPDDVISSKDFSNARYVRNLFERTWAKAAMRCQLSGKSQVVLTRDDFEHASADKEFTENVPKKVRIGFNT